MSRWLLLVVALVAGCSPASRDLRPMVAVMVRYEVMAAAAKTPEVPPAPNPETKVQCKSCRGKGFVGDGRIVSQCVPCGGTGLVVCKDAKCQTAIGP